MTTQTIQANPLAAVVAVLRADDDVARLAGTRVYATELPQSQARHMPRACVVVSASGGGSLGPGARSYVPWTVTRMDMRCYGRTPYEASQVYGAAHRAMKQLRRTVAAGTVVHGATVSGGPISARDPDADWPYVLGVYDVSALEQLN